MLVSITPNHIISAMWHQAQASRVSRAARAARGWAGGRATPHRQNLNPNRVYARHKHQEPVANIFGGSQARLIVAYTKNRSIGARLIRARL
jgi:hypothetical protein